MVSLEGVFWMFVLLFGVIGAMRGWVKEILVTISMITALATLTLVDTFVVIVRQMMVAQSGPVQFAIKGTLFVVLTFFGYQTPRFSLVSGKVAREKMRDSILGFLMGALNGYFLVGSLWWFMHDAGYPFPQITRPEEGARALLYLNYLPPAVLGFPNILFAMVAGVVLLIIVFV